MDDAEEAATIVNRASSCFASNKTKNLAVQLVTLYATYLKEKMSEKPQVEEEISVPTPSANANEKQFRHYSVNRIQNLLIEMNKEITNLQDELNRYNAALKS